MINRLVYSRDLFDREHQLWSRLTHPNLVQFFGYSLKDDYALIEHSNLGDLYSYLHTSHCLQPNQASLSFVDHQKRCMKHFLLFLSCLE